jgi:pyruvate dehydrogenase E2 component (dihydrolipoamide acetyltransferase)
MNEMARIVPITLPKWGLEMSEGTVTTWHLAEGDHAEAGAEIVDVETDKIVNSMEVETPGTLRRILVPAGEVAAVGTLIAVIADPDTPEAEIDAFIADFRPVDAGFEPSEAAAPEQKAPQADTPQADTPPPDTKATPLARRLAGLAGVDVSTIKGTGSKGRITRDDVAQAARPAPSAAEIRAGNDAVFASPVARKFANQVGLSLTGLSGTGRKGRVSLGDAEKAAMAAGLWTPPAALQRRPKRRDQPQNPTVKPFTGIRKSIATAMVSAKKSVPHFYTTVDMRIDALMDLRRRLNAAEGGAKISVNDLLIRAAALALHRHPGVNIHVSDEAVTYFETADIAVAVSIEGGLLTPVLRDAGNRSVQDISEAAADLVARARSRDLVASDLEGGTFTISNLGMYGVRAFDAIVNAPQGAILAVGGPRRSAVENPSGGIGFATEISATLSADHRAIDGVLAASFLATLRDLVEDPRQLMN